MFYDHRHFGKAALSCCLTLMLTSANVHAQEVEEGEVKPVIEFISATPTSPSCATIAWNISEMAGADDAVVGIYYGVRDDELVESAELASSAVAGEGSAVLDGLKSGRMYYAKLVVTANGVEGVASDVFSFQLSAVPLAPDLYGRRIKTIADNVESIQLEFQRAGCSMPLYIVYGKNCGGDTTNTWEYCEKVADVAGDQTSLTIDCPEGWGSSIKYLRAFFMVPESMASVGTKVAYINALGSQYINTGLYPDQYLRTEFTFSTTDTSHDKMTFGVRNAGYIYLVWLSKGAGTTVNVCWGNASNLGGGSTGKNPGDVWTLNYGRNGVLVDDEKVIFTAAELAKYTVATKSTRTLKLMGLDNGGSIDGRKYYGRCYGFKAFVESADGSGETLVQDLVPFKMADGTIGMYDMVSQSFFKNAGTGSFTAVMATDIISVSDVLQYQDITKPILDANVSVTGVERGDKVELSGELLGVGAGDVEIIVDVSRTGTFEDIESWEVDGLFNTSSKFNIELYHSDPASARYIRPGETTYFRVMAIDKARNSDVIGVYEFTTLGSMGVTSSVSNDGRKLTFTAKPNPIGANTNYIYVAWSMNDDSLCNTSKVAVVLAKAGTASFSIGDVIASELGTLYYSFVCSNDCSTAAWVVAQPVQQVTVYDNSTYTWKKAITSGNWEDAANWTSTYGIGYPTDKCKAVFSTDTTAEVILTSTLRKVNQLTMKDANLNVRFTGGTDKTLEVVTCSIEGTGGEICISNCNFTLTASGLVVGTDRLYSLRDNATNRIINLNYGIHASKATGSRVLVQNGSQLYMAGGNFKIGGNGGALEIDNGHVYRPCPRDKGIHLGYENAGGKIVFRGRKAKLEFNGELRHDTTSVTGGELVFVVPAGGYENPPFSQIPNSADGKYTTTSLGNKNGNSTYVYKPIAITIDSDSPGLIGPAFVSPLISWRAGITPKRFNVTFENYAANKVLYSYNKVDTSVEWSDVWTEGGWPYTIGFKHGLMGSVFFLY